ncbi:hypothetical protein HaLaN_18884 [Haematococcus lacustris]|uniref:Uncharacterized protein n=1 Tax=Haematococcus lacustris TaxID=44745 RepID=A0A699ZHX8_HAELA|nr:hypothetical protein HaLaN_18884 [Haematococcus lacustris]
MQQAGLKLKTLTLVGQHATGWAVAPHPSPSGMQQAGLKLKTLTLVGQHATGWAVAPHPSPSGSACNRLGCSPRP